MQRLISVGMDPRSENHPYLAFVFTSFQVGGWRGAMLCKPACAPAQLCLANTCLCFPHARGLCAVFAPCTNPCGEWPLQERATKVSHGGTARIAKQCGDEQLAKMCGLIAADESRHEAAYTRTMDAIFKA